jgi:hypothetical protein
MNDPVRLSLHRGQAKVYRSRARYRVVVAGRRWGKTELEKADATCEFGTPGKVWYVAPTYDMGREIFWEPLRAIIPRAWLIKEPNDSRMDMHTIWGCQFSVKSADRPDRLRGRGVRKLLIDEFQDWQDGMTIWEQVLQPMLLTTNGTALITGTPKQFNHLYTLWARGQSTDERYAGWESWQFRTADAPHIPADTLEQMRREMDPRTYRQEFEASFEGLSGRAYYAFARATHMRPATLDPAVPVCISFDFNLNPATAVIGQRIGNEIRVWREVWVSHAGGEATRAAALAVQAHLNAAQWTGPIYGYGDPAGRAGKTTGPSDHAVLAQVFPRASWRIPKAAPHVRDRIQAVNARCETHDGRQWLTVDPSCEHLISDLEQVVFAESGDLDKRSNPLLTHISDALGYWVHQDFPPVTRGGVGVGFSSWL